MIILSLIGLVFAICLMMAVLNSSDLPKRSVKEPWKG